MQPASTRSVFRFAPSPNGYLHLGHALSALTNYEQARAAGGRHLLRIEDIDPTRCRPEFEAAIYEDLRWLGITGRSRCGGSRSISSNTPRCWRGSSATGWSIPPSRAAPRSPASRQSVRRGRTIRTAYRSIRALRATCPLTNVNGDGERSRSLCDLTLRSALARVGKPISWTETGDGETREVAATPERWGDVILGRKETPASYHLAVVLDDALQGVTHVVRGVDLYEATSVHRLLQEILGLPAPVYHHHRLVLDTDGRKLSKRDKSTTLRDLRAAGWTPADVRRAVGL